MINAYNLILRKVMEQDLEMLRNWRNSDSIRLNMLDQSIISPQRQREWFKRLETDFHFVVEYKEKPIGYANFVRHEKEPGQTSLYIGEEKYRGTILAFCLALALLDFVFITLDQVKIDAIVLEHNQAALNFNQKLGYSVSQESSENNTIKMHLTRENYISAKKAILKNIRILK